MIHCSPDTPAPSLVWMVGSATLTTRLSSMGMNNPNTMATSTHHLRLSSEAAWPSEIAPSNVRSIGSSFPSFRHSAESFGMLTHSVREHPLILSERSLICQPRRDGRCQPDAPCHPIGRSCTLAAPPTESTLFRRSIRMGKAIHMVTHIPGPRSRAVLERKARVVCDPLDIHVPAVIDRGEGARITDLDGNTMLDFSGGLGCHLVGYSHPRVVEAVQRQAARFSHTDFSVIPYEVYVELAERLVVLTGMPEAKVALFNGGAEAVENAVKFARAATGRPAILCFEGAFHGRTLLTMTLTSRYKPYKSGFGPFAPEVYRLPYPYPYRSAHPDEAGQLALQAIDRALQTMIDPNSVAAAVVEPVQGEGGFVVPTPDFLRGLGELCRRHGILVISDEVQSGCGRTGRFLASEHFGFEPEIVVLAKALADGYPLSAVIAGKEIMDAPGLVQRAEQIGKSLRARWDEVARMYHRSARFGEWGPWWEWSSSR